MGRATAPYGFESSPRPTIALLGVGASVGLAWAAVGVEGAPLFVRIVLWMLAVVFGLVALGALMSVSVNVDERGLSLGRSLAGVPIQSVRIAMHEIEAVELGRTMTPGLERAGDTVGESPDTPRYRIDVVHRGGRLFVTASADIATTGDAGRLADALKKPLVKTGDWVS